MKKLKRIFWCSLLLLSMFTTTAFAAETYDPETPGSLEFTVHESNGTPVGGGTLTVTKVATIEVDEQGNPYFKLTPDFEGTHLDLNDIEALTRQHNASMIDYLQQYAEAHNLLKGKMTVPANGEIDFNIKEHGLYLVVQEDAHPGYKLMPSFLISVPQAIYIDKVVDGKTVREFDHYDYTVNASPKSDPAKDPGTPPGNPGTPPSRPKPPTASQTGADQYLGSFIISGLFLFLICSDFRRSMKSRKTKAA